jgi:hypothetical protein
MLTSEILSKGYCIAGNPSSALFRHPQSQNNYITIILIKNCIVNPVRCMTVLMGNMKSSWGQSCFQVDRPNPSPISHDWCIVRTAPLSLTMVEIDGLFKPSLVPQFLSILNHSRMDLWQSDRFSLINIFNFNISLLQLPMRKNKQTLILGCHSASF